MTAAQIISGIEDLDDSGREAVVRFVVSIQQRQNDRRTPAPDKQQAVQRFLQRWTGAGAGLSEETLRQQRTARLQEKHVK